MNKGLGKNASWRTLVGWGWLVVLALGCGKAVGLGGDHPNNLPVRSNGNWPEGMAELVNNAHRVHGFFVNDVDVFFFSGSATNFAAFLESYSKIRGIIDRHRLILHEGVGEAKSPWGKIGRACDWELYGRGNGWRGGVITNYVLEVHLWTGGRISLDRITVPANIEVTKAKEDHASQSDRRKE